LCPEVNVRNRRRKEAEDTCFIRDEEGPLGINIQVWVSNRLWVLQSKVVVLNAKGKGWRTSQLSAMKLNESKELKKRR